MIVLARFTNCGRYPAEAERLVASCKRFGIPSDVRIVADGRSWAEVCNGKPQWIVSALCAYRRPILCVDVDCEFQAFPAILAGSPVDFAAYNWAADPANEAAPGGSRGVIPYNPGKLVVSGGVQYWNYTAPAFELLLHWIWAVQTNEGSKATDQLLDHAYNTARPPVRALWLPKEYNFLTPLWGSGEGAVIKHHYTAGSLRTGEPAPLADCEVVRG